MLAAHSPGGRVSIAVVAVVFAVIFVNMTVNMTKTTAINDNYFFEKFFFTIMLLTMCL